MKMLVEAEYIQALWLGDARTNGDSDDLIADLIAAIRRLTDEQVTDALVHTCRMDVAVERLGTVPCACIEERPEDELGKCPTLGPALAGVGRQMMLAACESIRSWNLMSVNGGWVAAGVADDAHYTGTILIGHIEPLAGDG
ncbi:MAG: hypothetical protein DI630_31410 [Gordonia sp. (in: high G+C Gram-positive bacteria)]|nr:MAG: hypothetical protein DI630_31410 [Gordonia sp. (in: high G+C Gram-positive bacteria)]